MWAAPRVAHSNDDSHHAWLLRRRQGLFLFIRWFSCGVAPVFRPRQPTVAAPRPPPASFDATHGHVSPFYFSFSRRERAATQVVALARNGPISTQNEKISARCHCERRRVSCPGPGRAAVVILAFVPPNKTAFMSDKCLIFGFTCGVHRVTGCPCVARDLGRSTSNSTNPSQPTIAPVPPCIRVVLTSAVGARNGPRERPGRARSYDHETRS